MSEKRREFTKEFKVRVVREVEAGKSVAQAAREHQVHANLIAKWRKQLQEQGEKAFAGNGHASTDEARIAELERMIGQLTVENAFLKRVLGRLEVRSAERMDPAGSRTTGGKPAAVSAEDGRRR